MGRYINWDDVVNRYPAAAEKGASEVGSSFIVPAEFELDSLLGSHFTTPFSSNNYTAVDLSIELSYIRLMGRSKPEFAKSKKGMVIDTIKMLKAGTMMMITTSGDQLNTIAATVYSTTEDYSPTFGAGDIANMHVSSSMLYDEEQDRG